MASRRNAPPTLQRQPLPLLTVSLKIKGSRPDVSPAAPALPSLSRPCTSLSRHGQMTGRSRALAWRGVFERAAQSAATEHRAHTRDGLQDRASGCVTSCDRRPRVPSVRPAGRRQLLLLRLAHTTAWGGQLQGARICDPSAPSPVGGAALTSQP